MIYISTFFSAFVWLFFGSMILRSIAFRRLPRLSGVALATVVTFLVAVVLATRGLRVTGVPADFVGAAKSYVPAAIVAGALLAVLGRKFRT